MNEFAYVSSSNGKELLSQQRNTFNQQDILNRLQKNNTFDAELEPDLPISGNNLLVSRSSDTLQHPYQVKMTSPREPEESLLPIPSHNDEPGIQSIRYITNIQESHKVGLQGVWKTQGLHIIARVSRFIYQLKTQSDAVKVKMITHRIHSFINDLSSDYTSFRVQQFKNKTLQQIVFFNFGQCFENFSSVIQKITLRIANHIGVIQPDNNLKIFWDLIVVFFIVINIFYIPMQLSFDFSLVNNKVISFFFETLPSYIFIVEILLNFNTAYYSQGVIHTERFDIFSFYLRGNFKWDLLIVLPYLIAQFNIPYIQFVLLLRVTRVRSMIQNVEDLLNIHESYQAIIDLMKLIYFVILAAHMCACAWHLVGKIQIDVYNDHSSWLVFYGYNDQEWHFRYIASLYWSVITTMTVGYGDIVPQTTIERLFVIVTSLVICGVFGYTISSIGEIMKNIDEKESYFKQQMKTVNQYVKGKGLNTQLALKVKKYFEYQLQLQKFENSLEDQVMKRLNPELKQEVLIDIYQKILKNAQFFKNNLDDTVIAQLCTKVAQKNYAPGDQIVKVNNHCEHLYFILNGSVTSYSKGLGVNVSRQEGKVLKHLKPGAVIGEFEFFTDGMHLQNYFAQQYTQLAYISRQDFMDVLKTNNEYNKFYEIKEKMLFSNSSGRFCEICKWTHNYTDCPFLFFKPNKWKIMRQANFSEKNKRVFAERSLVKKIGARNNRNQYIEPCIEFIFQHDQIFDEQMTEKYLSKLGLVLESSMKDTKNIEYKASQSITSLSDVEEASKEEAKNSQQLQSTHHRRSSNTLIEQLRAKTLRDSHFLKVAQDQKNSKLNLVPIEEEQSSNGNSIPRSRQASAIGAQAESIQFLNQLPEISSSPKHAEFKDPSPRRSSKQIIKSNSITARFENDELVKKQKKEPNIMDLFETFENYLDYFTGFNIDQICLKLNNQRTGKIRSAKSRAIQEKLKSYKLIKQLHSSSYIATPIQKS